MTSNLGKATTTGDTRRDREGGGRRMRRRRKRRTRKRRRRITKRKGWEVCGTINQAIKCDIFEQISVQGTYVDIILDENTFSRVSLHGIRVSE